MCFYAVVKCINGIEILNSARVEIVFFLGGGGVME